MARPAWDTLHERYGVQEAPYNAKPEPVEEDIAEIEWEVHVRYSASATYRIKAQTREAAITKASDITPDMYGDMGDFEIESTDIGWAHEARPL